jgi:high-affinity Fe2+/Pb2+ permease
MNDLEKRKGSGISAIDTVLVVVAAVVGIFVVLWALRIAAHLFLFAFKLAILVLIVVAVVRVVHHFSRRD